jgi:hypothetical protein
VNRLKTATASTPSAAMCDERELRISSLPVAMLLVGCPIRPIASPPHDNGRVSGEYLAN